MRTYSMRYNGNGIETHCDLSFTPCTIQCAASPPASLLALSLGQVAYGAFGKDAM